jgi:glycosyltransferase involved in cell wall biosynthesis
MTEDASSHNVKVSVIIPTFNSEAYLRDALSSVASQSHQNLEVIVVDDGSNDSSVETATSEIARLNLRGLVTRRPSTQPKGAGSCRNLGVARSSGAVLAFLDSDDMWMPDHLERAVAALESNTGVAAAYCAEVMTFADSGDEARVMPEGGFRRDGVQDVLPELLLHMFVPNTTLCVQRQAFVRTQGYSGDLTCYEDWWFVLQLASITHFVLDSRIGCMVRVRKGSLSREATRNGGARMSRAMYRDQLRLMERAANASFLRVQQVNALRNAVVARNQKELSDHICAGHFVEATRIATSLFSAGGDSIRISSHITIKALEDAVRRGIRRATRRFGVQPS